MIIVVDIARRLGLLQTERFVSRIVYLSTRWQHIRGS